MRYLTSHDLLRFGTFLLLVVLVAPECRDAHFACGTRVSNKQCQLDPETMASQCPFSCQNPCICNVTTQDTACDCKARAYRGECSTNFNDTQTLCPTTCFNTTYEDCSPLPAPQDPNALLSTTETKYLTLVDEQCKFGYRAGTPIHKGRKICIENGVWFSDSFYGSNSISCTLIDCKQPPEAANAKVSVNGTLYQDKAIYTCLPGYQHTSGSLTLSCVSYGWYPSPPTCSPITCPTLPDVPNTAVHYSGGGVTVSSTVRYTCVPGSVYVNGSLQRTCNLDGSWGGEPPYCRLVECPRPPDPDHTQANYTGIQYGARASFACMPGYSHVTGNLSRSCLEDGTWSGTLPTCGVINCGSPEEGVHASSDVNTTTYDGHVTYSCDVGYSLVSGNLTRRCQADRTWSGQPANCQLVDCGDPGSVANADVDVSSTTYNNSAIYTCRLGYRLVSGEVTKTCTASGNWSSAEPVCELVDCGQPPTVDHTETDISGTTYGHNVTYQCILGYRHTDGDLFRTCAVDGSWTGVSPTCKIMDCGVPRQGVYASSDVTVTTYNANVTYNCDVGFRLAAGDASRRCQEDGSWSGQPATCQPVDCGDPGSVANADVHVSDTTYNNDAIYTCRLGYRLTSGEVTKTCTASGNWSLAEPVCELVDCGEPPPVDHTEMDKSGTTYSRNITYRCIVGYRHTDGDLFRTCAADGSWTGVSPTCTIMHCGRPASVSHADVTLPATTYGSYVLHTCHVGYPHASGDLLRMCQADGSWFGTPPVCQIVNCGVPPGVAHARASYPATVYQSVVTYACELGYRLVEAGNFGGRCQASGSWDLSFPNCTIVECGEAPLETGAWMNTTGEQYGDTAVYGCFYPVDGQEDRIWIRACGPEGEWVGNRPECTELGRRRNSFKPAPKEADGAVGVGIIAIGIVSAIGAIIFALDIITFHRHFKYMRENIIDWRDRWRARIARKRRRGRASHIVDPDVHGSPSNRPESRSQAASRADIDVSFA